MTDSQEPLAALTIKYPVLTEPIGEDQFNRFWWYDETGELYGPYATWQQAKADADNYSRQLNQRR